MKKTLAAMTAIVLLFTVTACGFNNDETLAAKTTTTTNEALEEFQSLDVETRERIYIDTSREMFGWELRYDTDEGILDIAKTVCSTLDTGLTVTDMIQIGIDEGMDPELVGGMTAGAVYLYCPRYADDVETFIDRWGF